MVQRRNKSNGISGCSRVGTVDAGQASAPVYDLAVSNRFPEIGEFVSITAQLTEGNLSKDFAFSWFNEIPETKAQFLNQPTLSFNEKGEYVILVRYLT